MKFSSAVVLSAVAGSALAAKSTYTVVETATITSCPGGECKDKATTSTLAKSVECHECHSVIHKNGTNTTFVTVTPTTFYTGAAAVPTAKVAGAVIGAVVAGAGALLL
ncbi:hypothetical protein CANCADRAFT_45275 [Tortispora caseinolytica NRRL Y-17796]|uniref:Uncharacterized protein n=1 Tax=Tortispora caseinolytica NRRL Y-17796 TaxID=767744 RepID=A0A1E4TAM6_9ASCO|nr:hypothetical protein CANCADRAFT_45275 [Tortispora caseinolytica NRRL Y-17796]